MKRITTVICLCVLCGAFLFMFAFSVCFPRTTVSDYSILKEWPEFSFETLFSGKYLNDVVYCFTDTIHNRDRFIDFETRINDLYGIEEDQQLFIVYEEDDLQNDSSFESNEEPSVNESVNEPTISEDSSNYDETTDISAEISIEESTPPEVSEESSEEPITSEDAETSDPVEQVNPEMSGTIMLIGTRALEVYYGNPDGGLRYAEILNNFANNIGNNVNVYSMVIPKASAYYIEQATGYDKYIYRNKNDIDAIGSALNDNVNFVNIYNILGLHASEDIYFRTDTHWTALGAYYATSIFAGKAGVSFDDITDYTEYRREGYIGTMYKYSDYNSTIYNNPEDFPVYYPNADYTVTYYSKNDYSADPISHEGGFFWEISDEQKSSWYSTFLRGDNYAVKAVNNNCNNGRKLLIVKDSYGNALAPFLINGFEEIYIVDARVFNDKLSNTIEEFGITDVLFAQCTFSAVGQDYANSLKEICG